MIIIIFNNTVKINDGTIVYLYESVSYRVDRMPLLLMNR